MSLHPDFVARFIVDRARAKEHGLNMTPGEWLGASWEERDAKHMPLHGHGEGCRCARYFHGTECACEICCADDWEFGHNMGLPRRREGKLKHEWLIWALVLVSAIASSVAVAISIIRIVS